MVWCCQAICLNKWIWPGSVKPSFKTPCSRFIYCINCHFCNQLLTIESANSLKEYILDTESPIFMICATKNTGNTNSKELAYFGMKNWNDVTFWNVASYQFSELISYYLCGFLEPWTTYSKNWQYHIILRVKSNYIKNKKFLCDKKKLKYFCSCCEVWPHKPCPTHPTSRRAHYVRMNTFITVWRWTSTRISRHQYVDMLTS